MKGKNYTDWNKHFRDWENDPQREGDWDSPSPDLWDRVAQDLPPANPSRPRPWWLGFLAVALVGLLAILLTPSAAPVPMRAFPIPLGDASPVEQAELLATATAGPSTPGSITTRPVAEVAKIVSSDPQPATPPPARTSKPSERAPGNSAQEDSPRRTAATSTQPDLTIPPSAPTASRANTAAEAPPAEAATADAGQSLEVQPESGEVKKNEQVSALPPAESFNDNRQPAGVAPLAEEVRSLPPLAVAMLPTLALGVDYLRTPTWPAPARTSVPVVRTEPTKAPSWALTNYALLPLDQGLQEQRRNWQLTEQQRSGLGLSLQRISRQGWFAQVGVQYEAADYSASTRFLRMLNPNTEREDNDQLVSDYNLDASLLKSSATPTTVTVERSRDQQLPENLRIVFQTDTEVQERHFRLPLYLGYQLSLAPRWGLQVRMGTVLNQSRWERRTTQVTALVPNLRVREARFPERVVRQQSSTAQLALGAGLHWQPHRHWQLGVHWQRIGNNAQAPQVLQQVEQQLLLGVSYRW
jgi:hypothetical protein